MKKYSICILLFFTTSIVCFMCGFFLTKQKVSREQGISQTVIETETVTEGQPVVNQQKVEPIEKERINETEQQEFYLVSEAGFLLVFLKDQTTVCLYTHLPITDFPPQERERLMEGIWFPTMMDVFNYLESHTS